MDNFLIQLGVLKMAPASVTLIICILLAFSVFSFFFLIKRMKGRGRLSLAWLFLALAGAGWLHTANGGSERINVVAWALFFVSVIQMVQLAGSELLVRRMPRSLITFDIVATAAYLSVVIAVLLQLGVNITGVFATSALLTAVIGLSLQDLILNLVAGLFVQVEGNLRNGLWIQTERESGQIVELRARYTKIETPESDAIYVPNSALMKSSVRVLSHKRRHLVSFPLSYEHSPPHVIRTVQEALYSAPLADVSDLPKPKCFVAGHHESHIQYGIHVWLIRPGHNTQAVSEVLTRAYFALHRSGIVPAALSQSIQINRSKNLGMQQCAEVDERVRLLKGMDLFRTMTQDEMEYLASVLKIMRYGPDDNILRQGDKGDSMFIITGGSVRVMFQNNTGHAEMLAQLGVGQFFGEMSLLTGADRSASIFAIEEVECLRIDKPDFSRLLEERSDLLAEISAVLTARQASLSAMQAAMTTQGRTDPARTDLMRRIERFFGFSDKNSKH